MFSVRFLAIALSIGTTSCVSTLSSKPSDLRFQDKNKTHTQMITVTRDSRLCAGDTENNQKCPIDFYVDNFKSGTFYSNNSTKYYLKPDIYNFKIKNCTANSCQSCDIDIAIEKLVDSQFVLSVDDAGKAFISNNGKPLLCEQPFQPKNTETTLNVDLAADTLFEFNGSSLNDLLPKGHQEVLDIASKISNRFISVSSIELTGHTDRLGSDAYNQQLGQNRADTVRNLLVQNAVTASIISTASAAKFQPVTNGCFDINLSEELKACLQPDRRVTVKIKGFSK